MKPASPYFEFGPKGYMEYDSALADQEELKLLAVFSGFYENLEIFDAKGDLWTIEEVSQKHKKSWWLKILVHSFYNPRVKVSFVWVRRRQYEVTELKNRFLEAVEFDDDILTQFVEKQNLKDRIVESKTFGELGEVFQWSKNDTNEY